MSHTFDKKEKVHPKLHLNFLSPVYSQESRSAGAYLDTEISRMTAQVRFQVQAPTTAAASHIQLSSQPGQLTVPFEMSLLCFMFSFLF